MTVENIDFVIMLDASHSQCCQRRGLPAQLGYFEILCRGSKNCWAGGLKLGYFSFICPRQLFFLQICQFPVNSESFWASSMSKNILFINFRDWDVLKNNQYRLSTSRGSQQSNCFSAQLGDFGYFPAEKHPNLGNWVYDYLIKIGLLWSHLPQVKKPIYRGLVLWSFGNTGQWSFILRTIPKYRHYDIAYCYIIVPNKSHTLCCRCKEASFFQAF